VPVPRKIKNYHNDAQPVGVENCWAKTLNGDPGINVRSHCENVGCVAEALIRQVPIRIRQKLRMNSASILAAAHDIGKVSPGFQQKCQKWVRQYKFQPQIYYESDHAKISQFILQEKLQNASLYTWAAIVGAHHGRIKGERINKNKICDIGGESWRKERIGLLEMLIKEFGPLPATQPDEASLWFLAGLISVADWIGSDERYFPPQIVSRMLTERREQAQDALRQIVWTTPNMRSGLTFTDLFNDYQPRPLQQTAIKAIRAPGLFLIEGPMGCGKTEAALIAAYQLMAQGQASGLYFALPTQLTSNRIHLRVQEFLNRAANNIGSVRLAHGMSWLQDEKPMVAFDETLRDSESSGHNHMGRSWFASSKRALLEPFGVGTVDQALLGIVAAQHFFIRQFGMAGKVIVLDEVHTYDLYTSTLIDVLIRRLLELGCTVIILSATLTRVRRRELLGWDETRDGALSDAYPLLSGRTGNNITPPVQFSVIPECPRNVRIVWKSEDSVVEECIVRARQGQCVLWIRNTVEAAQHTYRRLISANQQDGPEIALLHARFPFFRREELEKIWMDKLGKGDNHRPCGCVFVATQVAEQSVDLDADLLITDLAPTDMLFQRMGRLWRHERSVRPCEQAEAWIISLALSWNDILAADARQLKQALGKSARVYAPYVLLRSLEQWRILESVTLPADIRPILEATYADPANDEPAGWRALRDELAKNKQDLELQAKSITAIWTMPALPDEEGVQTRWEKHRTVYLLLARSVTPHSDQMVELELFNGDTCLADSRQYKFDIAKAIFRNLVRIPQWPVSNYLNQPLSWLSVYIYQTAVVGLVHDDGRVMLLNLDNDIGLSYSKNEGLIIKPIKGRLCVNQEENNESYD